MKLKDFELSRLNAFLGLDTSKIVTLTMYLWYRLRGKRIVAHTKARFKGVHRIHTHDNLYVGTSYIGFSHKGDVTYVNVRGSLVVKSVFSIGRGCRVDIGPGAVCELGSGYINANTRLVIVHGLKIGHNVAIAWDCEFIDEDFHELIWEGKRNKEKEIEIGDHVWIGSNVRVLKGVKIGKNNVIAAGSVVSKSFPEENVLIAGNPARIIKINIDWK
jgi:acyl-[acyl carrier protein]--UDP-N-acetylglucosamine O-acyltransferase